MPYCQTQGHDPACHHACGGITVWTLGLLAEGAFARHLVAAMRQEGVDVMAELAALPKLAAALGEVEADCCCCLLLASLQRHLINGGEFIVWRSNLDCVDTITRRTVAGTPVHLPFDGIWRSPGLEGEPCQIGTHLLPLPLGKLGWIWRLWLLRCRQKLELRKLGHPSRPRHRRDAHLYELLIRFLFRVLHCGTSLSNCHVAVVLLAPSPRQEISLGLFESRCAPSSLLSRVSA